VQPLTLPTRAKQPLHVLEAELLDGQKLQGTLAAEEVNKILAEENATEQVCFRLQ
jgi:hypothetical protein